MTALQADRLVISLPWAVVAPNIAHADTLSIHVPGILAQVSEGVVDGVELPAGMMLAVAVFLQIPLAMMVLTQVLTPRAGRAANVAAARRCPITSSSPPARSGRWP